jgi:hypothetical protein
MKPHVNGAIDFAVWGSVAVNLAGCVHPIFGCLCPK